MSVWLSAGVVLGGTGERFAALPSFGVLGMLAVALPAAAWMAGLRLEHAWPLLLSLILWLPFLTSSPIWDGPIEGIVWLTIAAGLVAARPPHLPAAVSRPLLAPWLAAAVVAIASLVVFSQVRSVIPGGDEPHYLAATQSLLHDADLKVANNYEKGEYLEYFPGRLEPHFLKRSTSGEIYSIHAPGVSIIVLPAFAVAGYPGAVWTMIVCAALTAALMWRLAFAISGSAAAAWVGVVGVCFSAPYFFHTFTIYPEIIGGFGVLLGVWLLIELANGREPGTRVLMAIGSALAALPWLHSRFAVLSAIIGILIVLRLAARSAPVARISSFLAVPLIAGAAWFAFFYLIWGSPSPAAPYGPDTSTSLSYVPRGIIGLLFDQQFGILTTAPVFVVALIGGVALLRSQPRLAIELALIAIPYAVTVAAYAMWWGGAAAPGRFLVAVLPLAALPMAKAYAGSRTVRSVALVLAVVSAALLVPRAFEDNGRFIFNNRSGLDATVQWLSANADLPAALPSVFRDGGAAALRSGVIWLMACVLVAAVVGLVARRWSTGARVAMTGVSLAACVSGSGLWMGGGLLRQDRELATLARFRPSWQTTIGEMSTLQPTTPDDWLFRLSTHTFAPATTLNRVPAGEYIIVGPPGEDDGLLRLVVGRNDAALVEASLDDLRNPHTPYRFRLPVMVRTLNVRLDSATPNFRGGLALRPVAVVPAALRQPATRAARYGQTRAFFFDEWAYPERDGFWARANGTVSVVLDTDEGTRQSGLPISITAGAVPTTMRLSMGSWDQVFTLAAGQTQDVMLPAAGGVWPLRIHSGAGFRPSEREAGSTDVRSLAAWIAIH